MKRSYDYLFIFLIGYQAYFVLSLLFDTPSNEWGSLIISFFGISLFALVWWKKGSYFSEAQQTMAFTTCIISISAVIVYAVLHFSL
ncbi:hypothetical protein HXA34_04730 [Salipaludibacillus agaradhaerens]|uniref:hypothetical protein n=1 Tax=Salipaludibacillus agaradhaerens TaxID=76935 RepID=UPI002151812F|nr:hypothetical protein [Salipaludibacillus agaradhaerens]MCR6105591.1 hypothetical protein [Salipaludibacillus agaradhaerens]MCR6117628.1 hypothetical protein [Salipaludibacillus agaradhaerens]UJW56814.1 hypothetical protein HXZ66_04975 [Bacillus sp. A116_S68]